MILDDKNIKLISDILLTIKKLAKDLGIEEDGL